MIQALALLRDAYRELNARKMFWVTLALSGLVVLVFAAMGVSQDGVTILWWEIESDMMNARLMEPSLFYTSAFVNIGVPMWLTWMASILALISTASIFPDFVSGGSIELHLSKPIGRLRLYLLKYLTGLLFVGLQVLVFTAASFAVIAIRGGRIEPGLFLAVPIVLLFYSYLFCVLVVVGQLTRSTVAALLITLLFWFVVFSMNTTEGFLLLQRERYSAEVERLQRRVAAHETAAAHMIEQWRQDPPPADGAAAGPPAPEQINPLLPPTRESLAEAERRARGWGAWHQRIFIAKTILPKTQETIALLGHGLISDEDATRFAFQERDDEEAFRLEDPRVAARVELVLRQRSRLWIIGTSLGFECLVLAFGAWRFCRQDF